MVYRRLIESTLLKASTASTLKEASTSQRVPISIKINFFSWMDMKLLSSHQDMKIFYLIKVISLKLWKMG